MAIDAGKIEGLTRVARESARRGELRRSSITALAERHGWEVHEDQDNIASGIHVRISRESLGHITGFLSYNRSLLNGFIHNANGATLRTNLEQLERFIVGVECTCPHDPDSYFPIDGPERPSPQCGVHQ